jgi:hypothetical protein
VTARIAAECLTATNAGIDLRPDSIAMTSGGTLFANVVRKAAAWKDAGQCSRRGFERNRGRRPPPADAAEHARAPPRALFRAFPD